MIIYWPHNAEAVLTLHCKASYLAKHKPDCTPVLKKPHATDQLKSGTNIF